MTLRAFWLSLVASLPVSTGVFAAASSFVRAGTMADPPNSHASVKSPFVITATIKELMDSTVDPAADTLWDSVRIIYTEKGMDERQPRTDEDWKAVRRSAITLIEAMNLIVMDGRHAATKGTTPGLGELAPDEIDRRIAATRPAFTQLANALRNTGLNALSAIDRKDVAALLKAGGEIDSACEACHLTYWYPPSATHDGGL